LLPPVTTDLNVQPDTNLRQKAGHGDLPRRTAMQRFRTQQTSCSYRLIDSGCEPHRQLDGQYGSLDEAIADAIAWVEPLGDHNLAAHMIGVDVSTGDGNWRTCRLPGLLLCPLLCELPG